MISEGQIHNLLAQYGAVITDSHVVYTSGKHGASYVNKDAIYPHTEVTSQLCLEIAQHFSSSQVEVVIAPAMGGVILSQWVAYHLTQLTGKEVLGVYAEKNEENNTFIIKRGYDKLTQSKKVLILEDILTTGGSIRKVIDTVRALPAQIIGVAALCNRGNVTAYDLGEVPELFSLFQVQLEAWDEDSCLLCQKKVPINTQVGKGREYLDRIKTKKTSC